MRLGALTSAGLKLEAVRYIHLPEARVADYCVNDGDLLISRANGTTEFVGRAVYVSVIQETVAFTERVHSVARDYGGRLGCWLWRRLRRYVGQKPRDIYIADLHAGHAIKVPSRYFR
jgi:type I restriction enzyme S subunit